MVILKNSKNNLKLKIRDKTLKSWKTNLKIVLTTTETTSNSFVKINANKILKIHRMIVIFTDSQMFQVIYFFNPIVINESDMSSYRFVGKSMSKENSSILKLDFVKNADKKISE
jgi:hypothetical protein